VAAPAVERLAPPLQAYLAGDGLAGGVAHARDLGIEGIQREQRGAEFGRREQGGEETILVRLAHQPPALCESAFVSCHGRTWPERATPDLFFRPAELIASRSHAEIDQDRRG